MKKYIVYDKEGRILRTGTCVDKSFRAQAQEGEFVLKGVANDITQKIVNGKIVNKTPAEIEDGHIAR